MGRVGVLLAGAKGAVGTTTLAGLAAMRLGLAPPRGMLSEGPLAEGLGLAPLHALELGGWDLAPGTLGEAARRHGILGSEVLARVDEPLRQAELFPAPPDDAAPRDAVKRVQRSIEAFRAVGDLERVVVVNVLSTEAPPPRDAPFLRELDTFEAALDKGEPGLGPSLRYAYAALQAGASFVNFTPNPGPEVPALASLARLRGVPYAGKDGKTGQTLYKGALAGMLRARDLRVRGWYSTNLLGNGDGATLREPGPGAAKVASKRRSLAEVLGYEDFEHVVRIDYYGPRGDAKEAWDVVDFEGWLGQRMSVRVHWLGQDSILAAPLVVDLARFTALAHAAGESGPLPWLALYFKDPHGARCDEPGAQHRALAERLAEMRLRPGPAAA